MEKKKVIRTQILNQRALLDSGEVSARSNAIFMRFIETDIYKNSEVIMCYVDYKNEVETRPLIEHALVEHKCVLLPRVDGEVMHFYGIRTLQDLEVGYKGILEPSQACELFECGTGLYDQYVNASKCMIMPGVAYDSFRNRIGYGGGYYDRYLESHVQMNMQTILLAYDMQEVPAVPSKPHDRKPDKIITESRVIA